MYTLVPMFVLVFTYLALPANLEFSNFILGFVIAAGILGLLRLPRSPVRWTRLPLAFMALAKFIGMLLYNVIRSGIQTARLILHPKLPIKSGIVAITAGGEGELGQAISAHAISLPPGELFVEIDDDGIMYIHSLDVYVTEKQSGATQKMLGETLRKILD